MITHPPSYFSTTSYCRFELERDELVLLGLDMPSLSLFWLWQWITALALHSSLPGGVGLQNRLQK